MIRQIGEISVWHDISLEHMVHPRWSTTHLRDIEPAATWSPSTPYDVLEELDVALAAMGDLYATLREFPLTNATALEIHGHVLQRLVRAHVDYQDETGDRYE